MLCTVWLRTVISARLGTGKGGVRFAPEEALGEVLQASVAPPAMT